MTNQIPFEAHPTSPELVKKVENSLIREVKNEEKNVKHVVKDLEALEKTAHKANKVNWDLFKSAFINSIG